MNKIEIIVEETLPIAMGASEYERRIVEGRRLILKAKLEMICEEAFTSRGRWNPDESDSKNKAAGGYDYFPDWLNSIE
jgi:hypothetical protein